MPVVPEDPKSFPAANSSQGNQNTNESQDKSTLGKAKAKAEDFISKGPQIPNEMPPKASREETEARMKELNK